LNVASLPTERPRYHHYCAFSSEGHLSARWVPRRTDALAEDDSERSALMTCASSTPFSAALQSLDGNAVVVLVGELDMDTAPQLVRVLDPLLEAGPAEIVLDFSGVTFIDSSGIAVLVGAQNHLDAQERHLRVQAPRPQALRVFEITGLSGFMHSDDQWAAKSEPNQAILFSDD
jgi:anti-anti-sigma factor